jgi:general secretion pathway protein K
MKARHTGAALLAAMLTVALVASMAAAALWQQWRSVEVETAERARVQSLWVLTGALDWARLILREDARSGGADHLGEPWAVPLEEARLSTFLAAEKGVAVNTTDAANQAFLSGYISDLQGRMNVLNLVENGKPSEPSVRAFAKLFEKLGLPRTELGALVENLRFAQDTSPNNGSARMAPLMPQRVGQLTWLGLSPRSLAILRPFITLLPQRTPVNINTASAPVLYATLPTLDMAQAERLITTRQFAHFRTLADVGKVVPEAAGDLNENQHSVNSRFFEIHGRLRLDQTVVDERSVVQRDGISVKTLWRDRGSGGVQSAQPSPIQ